MDLEKLLMQPRPNKVAYKEYRSIRKNKRKKVITFFYKQSISNAI